MPASTITPPEIQIAINSNIFQNSTEFITGSRLHSVLTVINAGLATIYDSGALTISIGATPVTGGATTQILYDNAGTLGGYTISGTGTIVAMAASPVFTSPTLGVAIGTSLALNGATIGSNALAATGTITASGDVATGDSFVQGADTGGIYMGALSDLLLSRAAAHTLNVPKLTVNSASISSNVLSVAGAVGVTGIIQASGDIVSLDNIVLQSDAGALYFGLAADTEVFRVSVGVLSIPKLVLNGASIGANALAVTGAAAISGALTAASFNGLTVTTSTGVLTIAAAKTLTVSHSITLTGTDGAQLSLAGNLITTGAFNTTIAQAASVTMTLPNTSFTAARTDAAQTFTGNQTFSNNLLLASGSVTIWNSDVTLTRNSAGLLQIGTGTTANASGSILLTNLTAVGLVTVPGAASPVLTTTAAVTSGAGAGAGTLTNAPKAGDPTKWVPFNDNGTTIWFPAWSA